MVCLFALVRQLLVFFNLEYNNLQAMEPYILAIQLALGAIAWLSAVKSLAKAENL